MASQITQEDSTNYIRAVEEEIREYSRLLRGSLTKVRKIKVEAELNTIKNNIWSKLCRHCRQNVLYLSRNQLNCEETVKQNEVVSHPLTNPDDIDDYKHQIETLKYRIKKKDQKLRLIEHKPKLKSTITTDSSSDTDHQENIDILTDELDEAVGDILKLQKENEEYLKKIKQLNSTYDKLKRKVKNENSGHGGDISKVTTKRHTAQNEGDLSLTEFIKNDMDGREWDVVSRTEARLGLKESQDQGELTNHEIHELQQKLDRSTQELEEKQSIISKAQKENEDMNREISELQEEKLMLQDAVMFTNELVKTVQESLHQDFNNKLDEKQREIDELRTENRQVTDISELKTEKQALQRKLDTADEEMKSVKEKLQQEMVNLTGELSELKTGKQALQRKLDTADEEMKSVKGKLQREIDNLTGELSELKVEKQTLQGKLDTANEEIKSVKEKLQQEMDNITEELEKKNAYIKQIEKKNESFVRNISELQEERRSILEEKSSVVSENDEMKSNMMSLHNDIDRLKGEVDEKKSEIDQVRKEHVTDVSNLRREIKTLQENLQQETANLIEELEKNKAHIERIENKNDRYVGDISELQRERRALKDGRDSLVSQNEDMRSNIKGLQTDIDKLKGELSEKDEEIHQLKLELKECQRLKKKAVVMRLVKNSRSGLGKAMVDMVNKELDRRLGKLFDSPNFDFSIVLSETPKDASQGPFFVLCLNMSRIGTNIQDALEGMKGNRDVYVLVLHHTNKENLSQLTPTSLRVTGSEVRQLGGIIDMAFSSDSGLYDCDLNNNAVDKIMTALKRY